MSVLQSQHSKMRSIFVFMLAVLSFHALQASDHADVHRGAANLGDFYVFKRNDKLVMIVTVLADLPVNPERFHFPGDVTYRFMIDRNPGVRFDDAAALKTYGGTIINPAFIKEDIVIEVRFPNHGVGKSISVTGLRSGTSNNIVMFAGIRDEPFIRGGFNGRNIASIVIELPLESVISKTDNQTILAWSTTDTANGVQADLGSHPYRSQIQPKLNGLHPSEHFKLLQIPPDVVIYNMKQPAKFPNGRELADDVVDLFIPAEEIIRRHGSNPSENDVKFLDEFPYLAPAHEFRVGTYPGPPENIGAFNSSLTGFNLENEISFKGRNARLRYWVVAAGGAFGQHFHDKRPAMVYLLQGKLAETKQTADGTVATRIVNPNEIFLEPNGVTHWVANVSNETVKMIVVDIVSTPFINRVAPGNARPDALVPPAGPGNAIIEYLAEYDLAQQFPDVEDAKTHVMRATRITLLPGERTDVMNRKDRPGLFYVVSGNVMEHRSDEESAVRRTGECAVATNGIVHYWQNTTSEPAVLFVVEFVKK